MCSIVIVPPIGADIQRWVNRISRQASSDDVGLLSFSSSEHLYLFDDVEDTGLKGSQQNESGGIISQCAIKLLEELMAHQWLARMRLHLVGHSTGGLVVKRALAIAASSLTYESILSACHSVAFFGTPHKGSSTLVDPLFAISVRNHLALRREMSDELRHLLSPTGEDIRVLDYDFAGCTRKFAQIWTVLESEETDLETLPIIETGEPLHYRSNVVDSRSAILGVANESVLRIWSRHAHLLNPLPSKVAFQITPYHQSLQKLYVSPISNTKTFEDEIMRQVQIDLNVFAEESSGDSSQSIKVFSHSANLSDLIELGVTQCLMTASIASAANASPSPAIESQNPAKAQPVFPGEMNGHVTRRRPTMDDIGGMYRFVHSIPEALFFSFAEAVSCGNRTTTSCSYHCQLFSMWRARQSHE